jgi:hypothetical protein
LRDIESPNRNIAEAMQPIERRENHETFLKGIRLLLGKVRVSFDIEGRKVHA